MACLALKILGSSSNLFKFFTRKWKNFIIPLKFNIFNYINLIYLKAHSVEITLKWKFCKHCHYFNKIIKIKQLLRRCGLIASVFFNTFIQIKQISRRKCLTKIILAALSCFLRCKNRKSLRKNSNLFKEFISLVDFLLRYWTFRVSTAAVVCFWIQNCFVIDARFEKKLWTRIVKQIWWVNIYLKLLNNHRCLPRRKLFVFLLIYMSIFMSNIEFNQSKTRTLTSQRNSLLFCLVS